MRKRERERERKREGERLHGKMGGKFIRVLRLGSDKGKQRERKRVGKKKKERERNVYSQ